MPENATLDCSIVSQGLSLVYVGINTGGASKFVLVKKITNNLMVREAILYVPFNISMVDPFITKSYISSLKVQQENKT
jgi:hypothetical protein